MKTVCFSALCALALVGATYVAGTYWALPYAAAGILLVWGPGTRGRGF